MVAVCSVIVKSKPSSCSAAMLPPATSIASKLNSLKEGAVTLTVKPSAVGGALRLKL